MSQQFASDNNAGICPAALEAMLRANAAGHAPAYGEDAWTATAKERLASLFDTDVEVFFVFNGTAANALALAQICRSYHAVIAHRFSHIENDEAGAVGYFAGGAKLLAAEPAHGKLTPQIVEALSGAGRGVHHVKPRALSLTQATELGTVYTLEEIAALTETARRLGLKVHMDGARFANAIATLGCSPADVTWRAGIDVLCLGGVKNGLAVGEAVLFFDRALAEEFAWRAKQAGHLNSKMWLVAAAWLGLLETGAWLDNARHANAMAQRLGKRLADIDGVRLLLPVESNAVFVDLPPIVQAALRDKGWRFHTFLGERGCRLMCAWDTLPATVDRFADEVAAAIASSR
ncbi:MAG TPA: low specificity L-threonine aldolase [Hyphomicrobiaceae bacterium]|nr:low specificity L-threonine aldolase [Hyphomicrobiaceae bacterium]